MTSRVIGIVILSIVTAALAFPIDAGARASQRGPAPAQTGVPPDVLAMACAPTVAFEDPQGPLRITGGQESFVRRMHTPGDLVTINAGSRNGIEVGQEYFVRRVQTAGGETVSRRTPATIRTTGWLRVYAVDDTMSLATITHACDSIDVNDYLEPFVLPAMPAASPDRPEAQRENYGRVMVGQDRRRSFAKDDFFSVDRGSDHGVTVGTRFVLYRDKRVDGNFLFELGEAYAVEVRPESSTLRITVALDAIQAGDYAAMRR